MSEVHRYQVVQMVTELGNKLRYSPAGPWVVMASEFDSMKICFDAQRLRADTAEAEVARLRETATLAAKVGAPNFHSLKRELAAAEQRIAELYLTPAIDAAAKKLAECMDYPWEHMPDHGRRSMRDHAKAIISAALNPNPEAESHE